MTESVDELIKDISEGTKKETGDIDPSAWFTDDKNPVFEPYLCAKDYLRIYPHVITEYNGTMHQYVEKYWLKDSEGLTKTKIEEAGRGAIKPRQILEAVESLRNLTRIKDPEKIELTMEKNMPLPEHTIPVQDGLLDLAQKKVTAFSPAYFYTEYLPRHYIPKAVPESFLALLGKLFQGDPNGELKKIQIFETLAWTLMTDYSIQGAVILYGQGGEGKSIVHKVFEDVLLHTASLTLEELENDKYKRAELYGSWANLISESSGKIVISEWFKRLTDGTTITVERKNQHPFQFASHAKMILDVNELPKEEGQLRAFYRRVALIIDFPNMLESVLSPREIDYFVAKLQEPNELDKIFSYVVDNHYGPLVERMKFTGHLSVAEAEEKWEERSNPAKSYIQTKKERGDIYTDVEDVKIMLRSNPILLSRYVTTEKDGTDYLTMVKEDVIRDARKWAVERGFPANTIDSKTLGRALEGLEYPNNTVTKKVGKMTVLRAWRDIYIDVSESPGNGSVTDPRIPPLPPQTQSRIDENDLSNGSFPISIHARTRAQEGNIGSNRYQNSKTLENTDENQVTADVGDPLPQPLPDLSKSSSDPENSAVRSENRPITLETGNRFRDELLNMGYILDPDCGPDVNQKYYKIGIRGLRNMPDDKRDRLYRIMDQEHFKIFNQGAFGIWWFTRPLAGAFRGGDVRD
jgi:hypothetical protein